MSELSNEELAMRIAAGEKNLTLQLWKQIENFVKAQAIKYYVCCDIDGTASFEVDDLIQEAYFALIQANRLPMRTKPVNRLLLIGANCMVTITCL